MENLLNVWKSRNLSLKGKITILKTLILPQIQFLFSMLYIPEIILEKIDSLMLKFLWNNKPPKIRKNVIIAPIVQGGLGMVDVHSIHTAAKCGWIRRYFDENDTKWKVLFKLMIEVPENILNKNMLW